MTRHKINLADAAERLKSFCQEHSRPPSYEEVRKLFRYRSKNAAFWLVKKLKEKGVLRTDSCGKVVFKSPFGIKLLGTVQAGFPSPAEEELLDTLSLDEYLIRNPSRSYIIRVTGDSMREAGIHEGDLAIVERGREPRNRDIVIARVDGEWTMKYYEKKGPQVTLVPANRKYPVIRPEQELVIGGVVASVIRKYK